MVNRRELLLAAGGAAAVPAWAQAQGFPNKPIRIVLATVAGSGPDIAVRRMTTHLSETLKQPVVVENRPGGNGSIAAAEVAKAPKDGYTLFNGNIGNAINDVLRPQAGVKLIEDLVPVTDLTSGPLILMVNPAIPVRNAREFVEYAKAHPNELNYGSGGPGSLIQLTGERLKLAMGIQMKEVPYKSLGADIVDLIAGHVQLGFTVWTIAEQHIKAGKLRALAVASERRMIVGTEIPTFAEAGLGNITATGWNGIFAPAGTPPDVVQALYRAMSAAINRPEYKDFFINTGSDIGAKTPEQFTAFIRGEQERYRDVVTKANIKVTD